jgi:phage terminase large subunit-like protein
VIDLSCPDWLARMRAGRPLVPDLQLPAPATGDRAVAILNKLRLFDVPGTPTMAEAGGEWFRAIVWALFASLDPATKARLIRELFLLVPKKQNKTTGGALMMLTALLMNERPRAPFLFTGPLQKTADDAFAAAEGAIALDNVLAKKLHVREHLKTIVHRETQAKLRILTFDPDVVTGEKVVGALIDEEHVLGKMPRAKKAMVSRI